MEGWPGGIGYAHCRIGKVGPVAGLRGRVSLRLLLCWLLLLGGGRELQAGRGCVAAAFAGLLHSLDGVGAPVGVASGLRPPPAGRAKSPGCDAGPDVAGRSGAPACGGGRAGRKRRLSRQRKGFEGLPLPRGGRRWRVAGGCRRKAFVDTFHRNRSLRAALRGLLQGALVGLHVCADGVVLAAPPASKGSKSWGTGAGSVLPLQLCCVCSLVLLFQQGFHFL